MTMPDIEELNKIIRECKKCRLYETRTNVLYVEKEI